MSLYSILITTYECNGKGPEYTNNLLNSILMQDYRPLQVIVSDHSKNDVVERVVRSKQAVGIEIIYDRYCENYGNACHNWNNALRFATGDFLHYFAMDDFFVQKDSITQIVTHMNKHPEHSWLASGHIVYPTGHVFMPRWNPNILQANTLSGPSAITIRKHLRHITLDPQFSWLLDLDWYYRLYKEAGKPGFLQSIIWANRNHSEQLSNTANVGERRLFENKLIKEKYGNPLPCSN